MMNPTRGSTSACGLSLGNSSRWARRALQAEPVYASKRNRELLETERLLSHGGGRERKKAKWKTPTPKAENKEVASFLLRDLDLKRAARAHTSSLFLLLLHPGEEGQNCYFSLLLASTLPIFDSKHHKQHDDQIHHGRPAQRPPRYGRLLRLLAPCLRLPLSNLWRTSSSKTNQFLTPLSCSLPLFPHQNTNRQPPSASAPMTRPRPRTWRWTVSRRKKRRKKRR